MLWPKRQPEPPVDAAAAATSASLASMLSPELFARHMSAFIDLATDDGGTEAYLGALAHKRDRIAGLTAALRVRALASAEIEILLGLVFTARRRLFPVLVALGAERVNAALAHIADGEQPAHRRLQAFVDLMPGAHATDRGSLRAIARVRRAAWDFGAELLHYRAPERYPLMSHWVWDDASGAGALREFMQPRQASLPAVLDDATAAHMSAHRWAAEQLRATGVYRDVAMWIDLIFARAYVGYLGAATQAQLGADFARGTAPREQLRKLLGIDRERALGRSRVRLA